MSALVLIVGIATCGSGKPLEAEYNRALEDLLKEGRLTEAARCAEEYLLTASYGSRQDSIGAYVATRVYVASMMGQSRFEDPMLDRRVESLLLWSKTLYGHATTFLADAYQYAGLLAKSRDQFPEAIRCFQSALATLDSLAAPAHSIRAEAHKNLAETYFQYGKFALAREEYGLELQAREAYEPEGIGVAFALVNMNEARQAVHDTAGIAEAYGRARRILELNDGLGSPSFAEVLYRDGSWRFQCGDTAGAGRALDEAISILGDRSGQGQFLAECLVQRANVYLAVGETDSAVALATRARRLAVEAGGPLEPVAVDCLMTIGKAHQDAFQHDLATLSFIEALRSYETLGSGASGDLVNCLRTLAAHSLSIARYDDALEYARRALGMSSDLWGSSSTETAIARIGYAAALRASQQPDSAKVHYARARAALIENLGDASPLVAEPVLRLATQARESGDLARARAGAEQALELLEGAHGANDLLRAECHHELGIVKRMLGDPRGARDELWRAQELASRDGHESELRVAIMSSLALLDRSLGDALGARANFEEAMEIMGRVGSPRHPRCALILRNLASLANAEGRFSEAEDLYERALAILESTVGPDHPDVAATRLGLGNALKELHRYAEAREQYNRAISIHREALGTEAPALAIDYHNLAGLLLQEGDREGAMEYAESAERISREHFRLIARGVSEREALYFAASRVRGTDIMLTAAGMSDSPKTWERAWDLIIRSRSWVLAEMATRKRLSVSDQRPEVVALTDRLQQASNLLAHLAVRGRAGTESPSEFKERLAAARLDREAAERALAAKSAQFRELSGQEAVGLEAVLRALPAGSALAAWIRYERLSAMTAEGVQAPNRGEMSYAAFVLDPATKGVRFVPLGPAERIDGLVETWRAQAERKPEGAALSSVNEQDYAAAGLALRRAVWDPVVKEEAGIDRLFLVPDGAISLVSFDALPCQSGGYQVERPPLLVTLSSERSLLERSPDSEFAGGLLTVGAPLYSTAPSTPQESQELSGDRGIPCGQFRALRFKPLPGTAVEVEAVARLWRDNGLGEVDQLVGLEASERRFRELATGRRVLHVATHGFFLGGECATQLASQGAAQPDELAVGALVAESPLLLSGIALSGADVRGEAVSSANDGILTAEEIAALDLNGIRLAVLSACGTGLGQVEAGEGVMGLQRAFRVAGVHDLIMSLWSVDDEATMLWMKNFFEGVLQYSMNAAEAVRAASLKVIRARREQRTTDHPYYWGAFIAASG